jgi:hypothetical protein
MATAAGIIAAKNMKASKVSVRWRVQASRRMNRGVGHATLALELLLLKAGSWRIIVSISVLIDLYIK